MNAMNKSRQAALAVVDTLQKAGFEAYFAGGCVRDELMGLVPQDYDVATSARPEEVLRHFPKALKVGVAFGVVLVRRRGTAIEVATFRSDGQYEDGRRPTSVTFSSAQLDAQRRDFTCNGLFCDPIRGAILDFVGGRQDIQTRCLRAIGDPARRFAEDHLRMLRAIRLAARLNFQIDPSTLAAISQHAGALVHISRERIGQEMRMILTHPSRRSAAQLLLETRLLEPVWQQPLDPAHVLSTGLGWLGGLPAQAGFALALAALICDISPPRNARTASQQLQRSWALSTQETSDLQFFLAQLPVLQNWKNQRISVLKRILADSRSNELLTLYLAGTPDAAQKLELEARVRELSAAPLAPDPLVTGDDLIAMGQSPGPKFRAWLEELYNQQLEDQFPDRAAALTAARHLVEMDAQQRQHEL